MKGLLKGFWWPFRLSKLVKYSWSYGLNEVCDSYTPTKFNGIVILLKELIFKAVAIA